MIKELESSEEGRKRLERARERIGQYIADRRPEPEDEGEKNSESGKQGFPLNQLTMIPQ